ncbi:MAG: Lar family restriction alleviation protein [Synergistaceae bacterium]|nr:Lar family restriction alleviation protein [Synergistaceae bacterium]
MTEELKPCPFCGGEARITNLIPPRLYVKDTAFCVYCASCNLLFGFDIDYGGEFSTENEAIEAWNRREEVSK